MICTISIASVLMLAPVVKPRMNTVDYFDSKIRVTERVLDRTICPDLERVQAPDAVLLNHPSTTEAQKKALREKAEYNGKRNAVAVSNHCKNSPRVDKPLECDLN